MTDWNLPTIDSDYEDFPGEVRSIATSAASMDYGSDSNIPDGVLKYNRADKTFYQRESGVWVPKEISGLAGNSVGTTAIRDGSVTVAKMASSAIDADSRSDLATAAKVQDGSLIYGGTSGGSANAQTLTLTPAITAYAAGQIFSFLAGYTNTAAAPTMNINGVGAITIYRPDGSNLAAGDIVANQMYILVRNSGSAFTLLNPATSGAFAALTGTTTIINSSVEADLFSVTLPAGALTPRNALRLKLVGDMYNVTGSFPLFNIYVKLGGTTIADTGATAVSSSNMNRGLWSVETTIWGTQASEQMSITEFVMPANGTTGGGMVTPDIKAGGYRSSTLDSSTALTLKVSAKLNTASANFDIRSLAGTVERV